MRLRELDFDHKLPLTLVVLSLGRPAGCAEEALFGDVVDATPLRPELVPGGSIGPTVLSPPGHDVARGRILDVELLASLADAQASLRDEVNETLALLARWFGVKITLFFRGTDGLVR